MTKTLDFRKPGMTAPASFELACPVFFVGFMGAGKTSTARKLARRAGVAAVDTDTYLERREGESVADIFSRAGEEAFRAIEADVLSEIALAEPMIVSCGGGIVVSEASRRVLKDNGFVIYLQVTAQQAKERIRNFKRRPLFSDLEAAERLCAERRALYAEVADATIDTTGHLSGSLARSAFSLLRKEGVLWQRK